MTQIEQIQSIIGTPVDDQWGPISDAALRSLIRRSSEAPEPARPAPPETDVHPFVAVAREWVGKTESSPNHFDGMEKLWADTNYPNGYADRAPYCAAFQCFIVAESIRRGAKVQARPVTPSVGEFRNWARAHGFTESNPRPGDQFTLLPAGVSHTGLVERVDGDLIFTLEGNTDAAGTRDGDGFWRKTRRISACDFIRIPILG